MFLFWQIVFVTLLLLLAQEAFRRANRWMVWSVFLLAPLLLTPYWAQVNEQGLFPWLKGYTIFFCVCWITALRNTSLGNRPWALRTIPLLLALNILEAVVVDLFGDAPFEYATAHAMNAAAGLLLVATSPFGRNATRIDSTGPHRDLLYGTSRLWAIGYTAWNWTFLYLNYPALVGQHTAVLAAALIVAFYAPHYWVQARAVTLGASILYTATFFKGMTAWIDSSTWLNEPMTIVAAGASLLLMVGVAIPLLAPSLVRRTQWSMPVGATNRSVASAQPLPAKNGFDTTRIETATALV